MPGCAALYLCAAFRCGRLACQAGFRRHHHKPPSKPVFRPHTQAVESQVNLEKLQQEAHAHNLRRAEVRELYQQVGLRAPL